jgi:hypothetical protein
MPKKACSQMADSIMSLAKAGKTLSQEVQPAAKPAPRHIHSADLGSEAEARIRRFAEHFEEDSDSARSDFQDENGEGNEECSGS